MVGEAGLEPTTPGLAVRVRYVNRCCASGGFRSWGNMGQ
jgi:hypothetical protein